MNGLYIFTKLNVFNLWTQHYVKSTTKYKRQFETTFILWTSDLMQMNSKKLQNLMNASSIKVLIIVKHYLL